MKRFLAYSLLVLVGLVFVGFILSVVVVSLQESDALAKTLAIAAATTTAFVNVVVLSSLSAILFTLDKIRES